MFAEVPRFYAEVERAEARRAEAEPGGVPGSGAADRPVLVGGDPRKRGTVQSATQDAHDCGVELGMSMLVALERCPRARVARTDMKRYREVSGRLRACLRADVQSLELELEPAGLEAALLDWHSSAAGEASRRPSPGAVGVGSERREGASPVSARALAVKLQERVSAQLGLPLRVGIAGVKFLARLAAEESGTQGVLQIPPGGEASFLEPLPLIRLPGVGPKTVATLDLLGARCIGDLLRIEPRRLEDALGNHGLRILEYARGEDHARVRAARHPQTLSRETTFEVAQLDLGALWERLGALAGSLEAALGREGLSAQRVAIMLRYRDGETSTRSRTLGGPVSSQVEIYATAAALLERTHAGVRPIARIRVTLAGLAARGQPEGPLGQLDLFAGSG